MAGAPTVSLPELRSLLAAGQVRLIDVRSREEAAAGTIPGALNIPVSELESALQMEPDAFQALYSAEKPKLQEENLIFFCQMGKRGLQATQLARGLGYSGYGAGGRLLGGDGAPPGPACSPALSLCLRRARNFAGAYREWSQKEG
ncbi:unnamed protein product [Nyctereutes procyonoides]|uniref:(raccoon dog) hypothetical protein n=1 Tax=Nyctereutes procyonoides TaxID=34880 RepID=A0A811YR60_NYCPR|nr:unnamed protein product [Nyctereutes procyonoides]